VAAAREGGIPAVSLDLIFAAPDSVPRHWERDLDAVLALEPDHLSLYGLTIESHTPLGKWQARGTVEEADDARYEREFLLAHDRLGDAGYAHYEVSNYARAGRRAIHNSAYWRGVPYVGLGPSAHGYDGIVRRWNIAPFAHWADALAAQRDPVGGSETLTAANRAAEMVYLGLRTTDGLVVSEAECAHVAAWEKAGWVRLVTDDGVRRLTCTPTGWLRLDALAADLTAFRSHS
jgi:oxygen-independent coproporphyrinogen-3 oxidase